VRNPSFLLTYHELKLDPPAHCLITLLSICSSTWKGRLGRWTWWTSSAFAGRSTLIKGYWVSSPLSLHLVFSLVLSFFNPIARPLPPSHQSKMTISV
jgi:hypothetical protein